MSDEFGNDIPDDEARAFLDHTISECYSSTHLEYETINLGTETVVDQEAWDEEVIDHYETICDVEEWTEYVLDRYETVIDQEAWDEEVVIGYTDVVEISAYDEEILDHYECSECGEIQ